MGKIIKILFLSVATFGTVTVNALANLLPINDRTTAELSDKYPVLFTPSGYVFSIWGLIYIAMIAFTVYSTYIWIKKPESEEAKKINSVFLPYIVSALANSLWIIAWHYEIVWLSVLIMLVLLASLLSIYLILKGAEIKSSLFRWSVKGTFSLYFGWISVATIANLSAFLYLIEWNGFGMLPEYWSAIMIVIAGILGVLMLIKNSDFIYNAVLVWAIIGIITKFDNYLPIVVAGLLVVLTICGVAAFRVTRTENFIEKSLKK